MSILSSRTHQTMWAGLAISSLLLTGCSAAKTEPTAASPAASESEQPAAATSPSATATPTVSEKPKATKMTLETYKIANGTFQIKMPSHWNLEELEPTAAQINDDTLASYNIVSEDQRVLAELRTGGKEEFDFPVGPNRAKNTVFDTEIDPTGGMLNYAFISYEGKPNQAAMQLTAIAPEEAKTWDAGLENIFYSGGTGLFAASLDEKTKLPDVPESLKGAKRFQAYAKTEEYKQLKSTMLSFKKISGPAPIPTSEASRTCVGAQYTYDLGDSGLSCDEAKSFLTKMLAQPISAGAAEIMGVGACKLALGDSDGFCDVTKTGGRFLIAEK